jgi:hypothetical protein
MIKSWTWLIAELQAERAAMFRVAPVWVQERLDSSALEWKQSSLRHRDERIYCHKAFVFSGMVERRRRYVRQCRRKLQPRARDFNSHAAINKSRKASSGVRGDGFLFCPGLKGPRGGYWGQTMISHSPRPQKSPAIDSNCRRPVRCFYFATATAACAVA